MSEENKIDVDNDQNDTPTPGSEEAREASEGTVPDDQGEKQEDVVSPEGNKEDVDEGNEEDAADEGDKTDPE